MRQLVWLLAIAGPLLGQNALYLDLSGDWKMRAADDVRFAGPEFDDRAWGTFALPRVAEPPAGIAWLRRSFVLPEGADRSGLVLTLGCFADAYEIFVDGVKIGGYGVVGDRLGRVARPESFAVPGEAVAARSLLIAVRMRYRPGGGRLRNLLNQPDLGPYVLTDKASAPVNAKTLVVERHLRSGSLYLVAFGLFNLLALLAFLLWIGEPGRLELLYLAGFLTCDGLFRLGSYLSLELDRDRAQFLLPTGAIPLAYLVMQVLSIRPRWLEGLVWLQWLYALFYLVISGAVPFVDTFDVWQASVLVLLATAGRRVWVLWRGDRGPIVLPVAICLVITLFSQRSPNHRLIPVFFGSGGYWWSIYDIAVVALAVVILALLVVRLGADRQEKVRLANEMAAARAIQQILLPGSMAGGGEWEVDPVYLPAQEVGGDFFQVFHGEDATVVAVGDVSGKGLKAAMVVSVLAGALRNRHSQEPAEILAELNRALEGALGGGFVTATVARFGGDGKVVLASAGHPAPYWNGREVEVEAGMPLGIVTDAGYSESVIELKAGDQLTFVSDGVVEAASSGGELFGFERTAAVSTGTAAAIAESARAWGQNDDITVVTVRRAG